MGVPRNPRKSPSSCHPLPRSRRGSLGPEGLEPQLPLLSSDPGSEVLRSGEEYKRTAEAREASSSPSRRAANGRIGTSNVIRWRRISLQQQRCSYGHFNHITKSSAAPALMGRAPNSLSLAGRGLG